VFLLARIDGVQQDVAEKCDERRIVFEELANRKKEAVKEARLLDRISCEIITKANNEWANVKEAHSSLTGMLEVKDLLLHTAESLVKMEVVYPRSNPMYVLDPSQELAGVADYALDTEFLAPPAWVKNMEREVKKSPRLPSDAQEHDERKLIVRYQALSIFLSGYAGKQKGQDGNNVTTAAAKGVVSRCPRCRTETDEQEGVTMKW
jgi:hypothetical protein